MRTRMLVTSGAVALAAALAWWTPSLVAQVPSGTKTFDAKTTNPEEAIKEAEAAARADRSLKDWKPPRTAWGDPDLRGYWFLATYTPLERPAALGDKAFYTEEEALAFFKKAVELDAEVDPRVVHYDWKEYGMDAWQAGAKPNLRTSLIVDPPNGRLPPLTPDAQKRRAAAAAAAKQRDPGAAIETFGNLYTRCLLGLTGSPLVRGGQPGAESAALAAGVSAESQLFQTRDHIVIITQSNSDVRVIPLDRRPHLPGKVRQWLGDSRAHWEGDTLVVETTNFNDKSPGTNFQGSTENVQLLERLTRIGPNTIRYQYTVTDPSTWTAPWSVEVPLPRVDPPIFEFACHEHNYGLMNLVMGTQIRETEKARRAPSTRGGTR